MFSEQLPGIREVARSLKTACLQRPLEFLAQTFCVCAVCKRLGRKQHVYSFQSIGFPGRLCPVGRCMIPGSDLEKNPGCCTKDSSGCWYSLRGGLSRSPTHRSSSLPSIAPRRWRGKQNGLLSKSLPAPPTAGGAGTKKRQC